MPDLDLSDDDRAALDAYRSGTLEDDVADNVVPFTPRDEARTCVPHGRRDCPACTAALDDVALAALPDDGPSAPVDTLDDVLPSSTPGVQRAEAEAAAAPPASASLGDSPIRTPIEAQDRANDAATQAWVDAKAEPDRGPDDTARAGAAAAVDDARQHRDDVLSAAMAPQLGLDLGIVHDKAPAVKLTDRFVVPPFSTLDSRQDYWKQRKRAWLGLGMQSELGRDGTLTYQTDTVLDPDFYRKKEEAEAAAGRRLTIDEFRRDHYRGLDAPPASIQNTGTSIFDPVLCEVAYRWFSPPGGRVVDPFAGGSVRGVVASILGRRYTGIELRPEQIAANRLDAGRIVGPDTPFDFGGDTPVPTWVEGSATDLRGILPDDARPADLIFTCPPYADLEVYSTDPRDLSTAPYATFRAMLASAMAQSVEVLHPDRFAVWVVGEARDRDGYSYGIIADTVRAALDAGLRLYNEAILETAIASAAMRATKQVLTSRKLVRVHQHVLVFVKGDGRTAALACGDPLLGGGS